MAHVDFICVCKDVTPAAYIKAMLPALSDQTIAVMLEPGGAASREFADFAAEHVSFIEPTDDISYDLLVVGCSTGNALERDMLLEAQVSGKPTVAICDLAYAFKRHGEIQADHYLVPNLWSAQGLTVDHTVVGDINATELPTIGGRESAALQAWADGSQAIFWLAQMTTEPLEMILERLRPDQKVLMGLHPDPKKWPNQTFIEHQITLFGEDRVNTVASVTDAAGVPGVNSDMAIHAFQQNQLVVVTGYSGGGTKALYNGYRVATVDSPDTRRMFKDENGFELEGDFLLPSLGLSPVIQPEGLGDIFNLFYPPEEEVRDKLRSFAPQVAVGVIEKLLGMN